MLEKTSKQVLFKVAFEGKPTEPIEIMGYLFGAGGELIAKAPVRDGQVAFPVSDKQLKRARVFFAPKAVEERRKEEISPGSLMHYQAYEPVWKFQRDQSVYEVLPIPKDIWKWWPKCRCRVRGRVVKVISTGSVTIEVPVCNARVHICEVDYLPFIIRRLPDLIIRRLRDELLIALEQVPIPPQPDPDPLAQWEQPADPEMLRRLHLAQSMQIFGRKKLKLSEISPWPEPPNPASRGWLTGRTSPMMSLSAEPSLLSGLGAVTINPQPEPPGRFFQVAPEVRMALTSNTLPLVRQALLDNVKFIYPLICKWPWLWPFFTKCDEVALVNTDEWGRFDTEIRFPCLGDQPDLYFWVEASIEGTWETVHRPPRRCNTFWNFACGSEVSIRVYDPRVPACYDQPVILGKKVVVWSIGRNVSMSDIYDPSNPEVLIGTVKPKSNGWIHSTKESPFGGTLEPIVDFGKEDLKAAGITHYSWSYRPYSSISEVDWKVIMTPVYRHYREKTPPGAPVIVKSIQIGPDKDVPGGYMVIDPEPPPLADPNADFPYMLDESFDRASAFFRTDDLLPGKYELKLELFKKVGTTMQPVDLTAENVELYEAADEAPFDYETVNTKAPIKDRQLLKLVGNVEHLFGYRLVVHVDNRPCFETINPVTLQLGKMDLDCGFLEYQPSDQATISFSASHPDDYAWFDFSVTRVSTKLPSASVEGLVEAANPPMPKINGFTRTGDTFSKPISVDNLFKENLPSGQQACSRAAFAENLEVHALATNGNIRLAYLDAPRWWEDINQVKVRAFALMKQEEE